MTAREWKGSKGVRPALAPPVGDDAGIFRPIPLLATRLLTKPFSYDKRNMQCKSPCACICSRIGTDLRGRREQRRGLAYKLPHTVDRTGPDRTGVLHVWVGRWTEVDRSGPRLAMLQVAPSTLDCVSDLMLHPVAST